MRGALEPDNGGCPPGLRRLSPSPGTLGADLPQRVTGALTNRSLSEIRRLRTPARLSNAQILQQPPRFVKAGGKSQARFFDSAGDNELKRIEKALEGHAEVIKLIKGPGMRIKLRTIINL